VSIDLCEEAWVVDPSLWALMQRIETLRYRAECLEAAAKPVGAAMEHCLLRNCRSMAAVG
jgi:hypothetical protein